ncbi:MAG: pyruvate kinase [Oscillospiraceae bacterium]|nr:pyruvate kinase [Oscillospiraceae bacterium]
MLRLFGTLGPACANRETLRAMMAAGMDGVRLNLSHTTLQQSSPWLEELQAASALEGVNPLLLVDLQGPELRIGSLPQPLEYTTGSRVVLGKDGLEIPECLLPHLQKGQEVLLDDGKLLLEVELSSGDSAICRVERGGILQGRKSIALPGVEVNSPALTAADLGNISRAKQYGVGGVMQPFVRGAQDLRALRMALQAVNAPDIKIYAKLENRRGIEQIESLLPEADEMVIARGDLGNAYPLWELIGVQKYAAGVCRAANKPFMVVTQMLASMEHSPVPTRAEVSDIFNAVLDGASSLMVTGETAVGQYPVAVMEYLAKTAACALVWKKENCHE